MKEHPILYSTAMVKAKLEGRKTQTRRIITPHNCITSIRKSDLDWRHETMFINGNFGIKLPSAKEFEQLWRASCKWQPGDLLWGRESGWVHNNYQPGLNDDELVVGGNLYFRAGNPELKDKGWIKEHYNFFPSIFMPKVFARIWDEVVSVRAERLQDITEEDAISEGIEPDVTGICNGLHGSTYQGYYNYAKEGYRYVDALTSYRSLWESINGPGSWDLNPLVWRVETKPFSKDNG